MPPSHQLQMEKPILMDEVLLFSVVTLTLSIDEDAGVRKVKLIIFLNTLNFTIFVHNLIYLYFTIVCITTPWYNWKTFLTRISVVSVSFIFVPLI